MKIVCKAVALATLAVMCLAAMPASAAEEGKLLLWINGDKGYNGIQKVGDDFTAATKVPVTVEHPEDAPAKFQQAASAGKGPDIWCWPHDRIGEWIQGGLILPIEPSKEIKESIDNKAWSAFTVGGKTYGYPLSVEAIGLVYNKALVKKVPATFEDVIALDKQLKKDGKSAILWDYNNTYFTWPLLAANGGFVFAKDAKGNLDPAKVGVASPGAIKGAKQLEALIKQGVMKPGASYSAMEAGFGKGEVAMMITGPWAWDNARKAGIDFGVAPIPKVAGKASKPFVGVLGCMISSAAPAKNRELAKEFLEGYMLKLAGLKKIDDDVKLGTPANKEFFKEKIADPKDGANLKATMANVQLGEPMPNIPEMGKFWSAMQPALESITNGKAKPEEALKKAAERITAKQ